jgi:hypothetical protein
MVFQKIQTSLVRSLYHRATWRESSKSFAISSPATLHTQFIHSIWLLSWDVEEAR